jgi:hypothetical protein
MAEQMYSRARLSSTHLSFTTYVAHDLGQVTLLCLCLLISKIKTLTETLGTVMNKIYTKHLEDCLVYDTCLLTYRSYSFTDITQ